MKESVPQKSRQSLLRKLTFMSGAVAALTVSVIAAFMIHYQEQSVKRELERRAFDLAQVLEEPATSAAFADDFSELAKEMRKMIGKEADIRYLVLTERDGRSCYAEPPNQWREETLGSFWRPDARQSGRGFITQNELSPESCFHYTYPLKVSVSDTPWGWIHVGLGLDHYEASVRGICQITAVVAGSTFMLASLASFLLARNMTEPLRSLQRFAQRVAAGAPAGRVEISSGDEIGDLADSINTMISSLALSQERLRRSLVEQSMLREKDILLREIHHRVKNNMQMLSSLMRLQARRAATAEAQQILRESEARIRSMGLIHEKLYQSENISAIDMPAYLKTLTDEIMRMGGGGTGHREVRLDVALLKLGLDTALPCGLIVTELVQNSLKYAFPDGRDGVILVQLHRNDQHQYSLVVWDNGVGYPGQPEPGEGNSLGMRLVRMLTDQLRGNLVMSGSQGTRVELTFTETQYQARL
jgi:two-component sensor histidine kinase